ncbi:MAG: peroxidase family protein, partial [Thalassolituus sp.]
MSIWVTCPALVKYGSLGITAGLLTLAVERNELFENNLFDFERWDEYNAEISCDERSLTARMEDGTCNTLENPAEGSVNRRFGRNVALDAAHGETDTLLTPNPRDVSNSLLARDEFKPATTLNFAAAAWIQFMTHDWFSHGDGSTDEYIEFALPAGDSRGTGTMAI